MPKRWHLETLNNGLGWACRVQCKTHLMDQPYPNPKQTQWYEWRLYGIMGLLDEENPTSGLRYSAKTQSFFSIWSSATVIPLMGLGCSNCRRPLDRKTSKREKASRRTHDSGWQSHNTATPSRWCRMAIHSSKGIYDRNNHKNQHHKKNFHTTREPSTSFASFDCWMCSS